MGYAGGTKPNPTYHDLGDHTESIQIDFDSAVTSFEKLLEIFWSIHNPCSKPWSRQYASILFYDGEEQKRAAFESRDREERRRGAKIHTELLPTGTFTRAEDYHQKYYLRNHPAGAVVKSAFKSEAEFADSTQAARANAFVGGDATLEALEASLSGMDAGVRMRILDVTGK